MPITVKNWIDLPSELLPESGESVFDWHARIVAYNVANPGVLTLINAAGLEDLESRMGAYTDTQVATKANSSHTHTVADLGTGTPASGKYLDGAGAWTTLPSAGSGFAPDPSAQPDGKWLKVVGGAYVFTDPPSGTVPSGTDGQLLGFVGTTLTALDVDTAVTAADIPFTPGGALAATNSQAAIAEASSDFEAHLTDTVDAHDASAISYQGGTGTSATDVEGALDEISLEKADKLVAINNQIGTSYTLVAGDAAGLVRVSNAGTHTLTVPPNSSVAFAVGTVINVARVGAGAVNLAAGSGVTINSPGAVLGLRAQYSQATLIKTATDTWLLGGDIA